MDKKPIKSGGAAGLSMSILDDSKKPSSNKNKVGIQGILQGNTSPNKNIPPPVIQKEKKKGGKSPFDTDFASDVMGLEGPDTNKKDMSIDSNAELINNKNI